MTSSSCAACCWSPGCATPSTPRQSPGKSSQPVSVGTACGAARPSAEPHLGRGAMYGGAKSWALAGRDAAHMSMPLGCAAGALAAHLIRPPVWHGVQPHGPTGASKRAARGVREVREPVRAAHVRGSWPGRGCVARRHVLAARARQAAHLVMLHPGPGQAGCLRCLSCAGRVTGVERSETKQCQMLPCQCQLCDFVTSQCAPAGAPPCSTLATV
jgi:hypothetical protein